MFDQMESTIMADSGLMGFSVVLVEKCTCRQISTPCRLVYFLPHKAVSEGQHNTMNL